MTVISEQNEYVMQSTIASRTTKDKTRFHIWYKPWCVRQTQSVGNQPTAHLIISPAVSCHYFLPGLQLTSKLRSITGRSSVTTNKLYFLLGTEAHVWTTWAKFTAWKQYSHSQTCNLSIDSLTPRDHHPHLTFT